MTSDHSAQTETVLHATTVAHHGRAMALLGPSGSGKSSLALQLIALGAVLVSDDRTHLQREGATIFTAPPPNLAGLIEARHVGILALPHLTQVPLAQVVDLDELETDRLPSLRHIKLLGVELPLFRRAEGPHFPTALLHCLSGSRQVP